MIFFGIVKIQTYLCKTREHFAECSLVYAGIFLQI